MRPSKRFLANRPFGKSSQHKSLLVTYSPVFIGRTLSDSYESDYIYVHGPEMIRVSKFYKESKEGKFVSFMDKDVRTLYDSFRKGAKESNNGPCLGWRESFTKPYQWLHYNETLLRAKNFGSGLVSHGLYPSSETFIGIYSQNCPEWILTEQAAYCYSMVIVPLYDTLGPDACAYIIKQTEISVVVCDDDAKCNLILDKAPRCLKKLIVIRETRPATNQRARNRGVEIIRFEDVEKLGASKDNPEVVRPFLDNYSCRTITRNTL
uniref:long-chain-fatty-acid--CoA ligase n=1 Tax=Timema tahoe TaxID=61484 RepID=A0A7R9ISV8_9NEOP|nr:unnamed protein product [Timema tahoe]